MGLFRDNETNNWNITGLRIKIPSTLKPQVTQTLDKSLSGK